MNKKFITIGFIFMFLVVGFSGCNESNDKSNGNTNIEYTKNYNYEFVRFYIKYNEKIHNYSATIDEYYLKENYNATAYWCERVFSDSYLDMYKLFDFQISDELVTCRGYLFKGYEYIFDAFDILEKICTGNNVTTEASKDFSGKIENSRYFLELGGNCIMDYSYLWNESTIITTDKDNTNIIDQKIVGKWVSKNGEIYYDFKSNGWVYKDTYYDGEFYGLGEYKYSINKDILTLTHDTDYININISFSDNGNTLIMNNEDVFNRY